MKYSILLLYLLLCNDTLMANEYAVVTSKNLSSLSIGQIKALFLKRTLYINDNKIVPLNLSPRDSIRNSFERNILHMGFTRLKSYWSKQHYLGHRPPISLKSQKSVQVFLKKVDNAIGYMEVKEVPNNLHIVYKWSD